MADLEDIVYVNQDIKIDWLKIKRKGIKIGKFISRVTGTDHIMHILDKERYAESGETLGNYNSTISASLRFWGLYGSLILGAKYFLS